MRNTNATGSSSRHSWRTGQLALLAMALAACGPASAAVPSGQQVVWQPLTLDLVGPGASETDDAPNPFLDLRADVTFVSPSGQRSEVPGFFAGNGRGHGTGNLWRVRFTPDEPGTWQWSVDFRSGTDVAVADAVTRAAATTIGEHGARGSVEIAPRDPRAPGLLASGRIEYVGEHYLKQADGGWWLKSGLSSPENFFGFAGFDNTSDQPGGVATPSLLHGLHRYATHVSDWRDGDPRFFNADTGIDGRGIIGAVNYLADQGINSIPFVPLNLAGNARDTQPFIGASGSDFDNTHYDVSRLAQWNLVLDHMQRRGVSAHVVLSDQADEAGDWLARDGQDVQRKLFLREMVARFAYLNGIKWNLGDTGRYGTTGAIESASWLRDLDWANHPVAVRTARDRPEPRYQALLGNPDFDITAIRSSPANADRFAETWRKRSADAGWKWVIELDDVGPAGTGVTDSNMAELRRSALYPALFSGASIEWFFGHDPLPMGGDLQTEDFRTREPIYRWSRIARELLLAYTPLERMRPADDRLVGARPGDQVFSAPGEVHALYLVDGQAGRSLELAAGDWQLAWFDPRTGEFVGAPTGLAASAGTATPLGEAPADAGRDWVALLRSTARQPPVPVTAAAQPANDGGGTTGLIVLIAQAGLLLLRRRRMRRPINGAG